MCSCLAEPSGTSVITSKTYTLPMYTDLEAGWFIWKHLPIRIYAACDDGAAVKEAQPYIYWNAAFVYAKEWILLKLMPHIAYAERTLGYGTTTLVLSLSIYIYVYYSCGLIFRWCISYTVCKCGWLFILRACRRTCQIIISCCLLYVLCTRMVAGKDNSVFLSIVVPFAPAMLFLTFAFVRRI